jgi:hypothetical protein
MPADYKCTSCDWETAVGNYHGASDWFHDLYCRHCGAKYTFAPEQMTLNDQPITIDPNGEAPIISCVQCGAEGPLGARGPITDQEPTTCPKCKTGTVKLTAFWIS